MSAHLLLGVIKAQLLFGGLSRSGFSGILHNIASTVQHWGDYVLLLVGIVLITYGCLALFHAIKGLGNQQQGGGGVTWVKAILAIILGIVLSATKISDIKNNGSINGSTVRDALNGKG